MARFNLVGTHKGNFLGIPATGKKIEMGGMLACRFVERNSVSFDVRNAL
jgi:predicted ester cyclase